MKFKLIFISLALTLFTNSAFAGATNQFPVEIDLVNRSARGNMATARFSDNENELIGCGVRYLPDGTGILTWAFCQARMADLAPGENTSIGCTTFNADLIDAIKAIGDYSLIAFSWNEAGECIRIGNSTQSFYIP